MMKQQPFKQLKTQLARGELNRRAFLASATAMGMSASVATMIADATAQVATPTDATPHPAESAQIPDFSKPDQQRGEGEELKILQWQAPSHMNGVVATGEKELAPASMIQESLLVRLPDGTLVPQLAETVPTLENGMVSEDLKSVTFKLKEGVLWSDGEPLSSADVEFTVQWVLDEENGAIVRSVYESIDDMTIVDDLTITLHFAEPNPAWAETFTKMGSRVVLPRHVLEGASEDELNDFLINPVGTGPYVVEDFIVNDQVTLVPNENYRQPNKPFFSRVVLKGGGDAMASARASIQTGEYDFGWNLAANTEFLQEIATDDAPGQLVLFGGRTMERINFNFSDPNAEVDGQRSEKNTPHPFLSDVNVRKAITMAVDRELISDRLYFGSPDEPAVANVLTGMEGYESSNTTLVYDPEAASQLLEDAGWHLNGNTREKDGEKLSVTYYTSTSPIRQQIQAVVKANLEAVGFEVHLEQNDSSIFFDPSPGNDQNNYHFYSDLNQFSTGADGPPPIVYMARWYAGPDGENIAQKSNDWTGSNIARYQSAEYDAIYEQLRVEPDPEVAAELCIQLNDILYNDAVLLPLVRFATKAGVSRRLNLDSLALSNYEYTYWNIANWVTVDGA